MSSNETVTINFINAKGETIQVNAPTGISLLEASQIKDTTKLEGSCGGVMACTTCHVIIDDEWYDKIPSISNEEDDTLDMAFNVQPTSRLGCQITVTKDMDGIIVHIPPEIEIE